MTPATISKGFLFAGFSNILGVVIFSKFFTNRTLMETQPDVMGYFGLISIVLWGLAYISVRKNYTSLRWLVGVFMIEKLVYVIVYVRWFSTNALHKVYDQDIFAGIFYTIYGVNDFLFGLFFAWVFFNITKIGKVHQ